MKRSAFDTHTSATLLIRLQDLDDHSAWTAFVERYAPVVFSWCRKFQLQDSDAADVTQDVLVKLMRSMRDFRYEPGRGRFRGWLKTVTANTIRDLSRSWEQRLRSPGGAEQNDVLGAIQGSSALDELAAEIESQYERELLQRACEQVRLRVKPATWQAWEFTTVRNQKAAAVANQLSISVGDVYVSRSRVNKMLTEEVARLQRVDEVGTE